MATATSAHAAHGLMVAQDDPALIVTYELASLIGVSRDLCFRYLQSIMSVDFVQFIDIHRKPYQMYLSVNICFCASNRF